MAEDGFVDNRGYFNTMTFPDIGNLLGNVGVGVTINPELKSVILESQSMFALEVNSECVRTYLTDILGFPPITNRQN